MTMSMDQPIYIQQIKGRMVWHSKYGASDNYLAWGTDSVLATKGQPSGKSSDPWLCPPAPGILLEAISVSKHSFNSITTWLMSGLSIPIGATHAKAVSTAFQAELVLKSPCNLGSTMHRTSPVSIIILTHATIWMLPGFFLAGRPVITSNKTIPKL